MTKHYEQRKKANEKYLAKLDEIRTRVPMGEKEKLAQFVEECGYPSMNQFVRDAIEFYKEAVLRDMKNNAARDEEIMRKRDAEQ
jgi:hypothetical protein